MNILGTGNYNDCKMYCQRNICFQTKKRLNKLYTFNLKIWYQNNNNNCKLKIIIIFYHSQKQSTNDTSTYIVSDSEWNEESIFKYFTIMCSFVSVCTILTRGSVQIFNIKFSQSKSYMGKTNEKLRKNEKMYGIIVK